MKVSRACFYILIEYTVLLSQPLSRLRRVTVGLFYQLFRYSHFIVLTGNGSIKINSIDWKSILIPPRQLPLLLHPRSYFCRDHIIAPTSMLIIRKTFIQHYSQYCSHAHNPDTVCQVCGNADGDSTSMLWHLRPSRALAHSQGHAVQHQRVHDGPLLWCSTICHAAL
jgi:hypothetical protein